MIQTNVSVKNTRIIMTEVNQLLVKGAIETVPANEKQDGFYSTFFLVPKKTGDLRPVINLKPLNRYLKKQHFKMDSLHSVLNMVQKGDWAISLDLKDAYFHIPCHRDHKKFLRFCINKQCFQFKVLCFGPTSAPRVFTKVCAVVVAHLRTQNIRLAAYLDDWFVVNQNQKNLLTDREKSLNLLKSLGFIINLQKSQLKPTQSITYIGAKFSLKEGIVCPTIERVTNLHKAIQKILNMQNVATARDYLHLLGIMASCIELIPNARLFMRPIQLHLLFHWRPASQKLEMKIPFSEHLKNHLQWWLNNKNVLKGRQLAHWESSAVITTDASMEGYGGHLNGKQIMQGVWSPKEKIMHINSLEMEAVFKTLKHFICQLKGKNVLIRSDNTTVVQYINKQGGTHSPQLCIKTWNLWHLALENQITLKAAHIAGRKNILADDLSRIKILPTEWTLKRAVVQALFQTLGEAQIDLFASKKNRQTQIYCSWIQDPQAYAIDALTIPWENMFAYAYPPICLIPKILQHMEIYNCQIILIAPFWPRRHWYPKILQYLIANPIRLPALEDLLHQPMTNIYHPNPSIFNLTAWMLSTNLSKRKDFLRKLENYSQPHGELGPKKIIQSNFENSVAGVVEGKLIPIISL